MTRQRALRLAREWAQGHVCSLRDGEAAEYHAMFAAMLEKALPNEWVTLEELRRMAGVNALWLQKLSGTHKPRLMLIHSVSDGWWTCCDFNGFVTFNEDDYGKQFLLYRFPPERQEAANA